MLATQDNEYTCEKIHVSSPAGKIPSPPTRGAGWIQRRVATNGEGLKPQAERCPKWSISSHIKWQCLIKIWIKWLGLPHWRPASPSPEW
uniref:Uncharacterized protein n=1 Tax=Romanomermis culicivorax TaxID=13658 RepID=A0A915JY97_ROMCU